VAKQSVGSDPPSEQPLPDYELESAIRRKSATFQEWAEAYFFSAKEYHPDYDRETKTLPLSSEAIRQRYRRYLEDGLFAAFENAQGPVESSYYCQNLVAAAMLTVLPRRPWLRLVWRDEDPLPAKAWQRLFWKREEPRLHVMANLADAPISDRPGQTLADLLTRCQEVGSKANQLLVRRDRRICLELAFNAASDVLAELDTRAVDPREGGSGEQDREEDEGVGAAGHAHPRIDREGRRERDQARRRRGRVKTREREEPADPAGRQSGAVGVLTDSVVSVEEFYRSAARQRARLVYFLGMLIGLVPVGALLWLVRLVRVPAASRGAVLGAFIAGAVGAIVSVLWRMTRNRFRISYETSMRYVGLMGSFRPTLGAFFALIAYVALASGVLRLDVNVPPRFRFAFYLLVGFFAGFSERLAQDVIARSRGALGGNGEDEDPAEEDRGRRQRRLQRRRRRRGEEGGR
jgi:hypothetical protein